MRRESKADADRERLVVPSVEPQDELVRDVPDAGSSQEAFLAQVAAVHAAARDRRAREGRNALRFSAYATVAFVIWNLHVPPWVGWWMFALAVFWLVRAGGAAIEWNIARIQSTLSPF